MKNRNTALVLIGAGLFLLLGNMVGFFTIAAVLLLWLAVHKLRDGENKTGYILLIVGVLMLIGDYLSFIVAIILISLGYFYLKSKQIHRDESYIQKQKILESLKWNQDPWVLENMSLWSIVGEVHMDMSLALAEKADTVLILQGIVGDVDIIVSEEIGVLVEASVLFGHLDVGGERESGIMKKIVWKSSNYDKCDHKVKFVISYVVGDIDIKVL